MFIRERQLLHLGHCTKVSVSPPLHSPWWRLFYICTFRNALTSHPFITKNCLYKVVGIWCSYYASLPDVHVLWCIQVFQLSFCIIGRVPMVSWHFCNKYNYIFLLYYTIAFKIPLSEAIPFQFRDDGNLHAILQESNYLQSEEKHGRFFITELSSKNAYNLAVTLILQFKLFEILTWKKPLWLMDLYTKKTELHPQAGSSTFRNLHETHIKTMCKHNWLQACIYVHCNVYGPWKRGGGRTPI